MAGYFGKLAGHGDFIRHNADPRAIEVIDRWFAAGQLDDQRGALFDQSGPTFAMFMAGDRWWSAVMFPSADSVGRRYPFVIFNDLPANTIGSDIGLLPMAFVPCFQSTFLALRNGLPQGPKEAQAMLAQINGPADPASEANRLVRGLANVMHDEVWKSLLGSFDDPRKKWLVDDLIALAIGEIPADGLLVRPVVHQLHCGFWMTLLWLLRNKRDVPVLMVLHPATGRQPATTVLWDRPAPKACFSALWPSAAVPGSGQGIHDLVANARRAASAVPILPQLQDPECSLRELLDTLVAVARERQRRVTR